MARCEAYSAVASKLRSLTVLSAQAPEYPFPFAIDEAYDAYKLLYESKGKVIGMSGKALNIVMTGDSACVDHVSFFFATTSLTTF
jgi:acetyl esterase/lipase